MPDTTSCADVHCRTGAAGARAAGGAVTPVHAQTPAAWDDAMADFCAADAIMIKFRDAAAHPAARRCAGECGG
ncbi:MAG: hypothetical protein R2838_20985 [Caldilineaceae bacterium]